MSSTPFAWNPAPSVRPLVGPRAHSSNGEIISDRSTLHTVDRSLKGLGYYEPIDGPSHIAHSYGVILDRLLLVSITILRRRMRMGQA